MVRRTISGFPIKEFGAGLLHLFYPRLCEGCGKTLLASEELLCLGCDLSLAMTGYHHLPENETSLRLVGRIPFSHASSFLYFTDGGLTQHLVSALKYRNRKEIGGYLGRRLGQELKASGWTADAIIPIPLHRKKEALRGYNQSALIAHGISECLAAPVIKDALIRKKNTETQTDKTRLERVINLADAFIVSKPVLLHGKRLLLVDDVLTTGATVESAASAILSASKDVNISVVTIAIAAN